MTVLHCRNAQCVMITCTAAILVTRPHRVITAAITRLTPIIVNIVFILSLIIRNNAERFLIPNNQCSGLKEGAKYKGERETKRR